MDIVGCYQQHALCGTAGTTRTYVEAGSVKPIRGNEGGPYPNSKKTAAWWNLTQEERGNVFENKSHHIAEGVRYLPSVARQLYDSRDIGEPFDFLTWFEYAPQHSEAFEELVRKLRNTEEWRFVDREVDIRLERD